MDIVMLLAPTSILLGLAGLAAFWWTVKNDQYSDPEGDAARILDDHEADGPS
jgi:cbb3-type cytochrome oxidase maturation protein